LHRLPYPSLPFPLIFSHIRLSFERYFAEEDKTRQQLAGQRAAEKHVEVSVPALQYQYNTAILVHTDMCIGGVQEQQQVLRASNTATAQ
jgi:hypothetical protein